jgi:signal transduction histidine kinase
VTPPVGSLRLRLLLGAAVWILLALVIAGLVLAELFARHVQDRFAVELGHHLDQLASSLRIDAEGKPELSRPLPDPRFSRPLSGLYWQVAANGRVVLRSRSLWDQTLALPADASAEDGRAHQWRIGGPEHQPLYALERSLLLPEGPESLQVVVAEDLGELDAAFRAFNRTLALSLAALAVALTVAAVVQVALGLRPLGWLRDELAEIRSGRKRRFERAMPSEVQPLIDDLNALLDHADEVVERARLQAGNLAHGLKTNLAVLANEAERLAEPDAQRDVADVARLMLSQVATMRRHIDHHMARARAAASRGMPGAGTDVADCVSALVRVMQKVHAGRDLAISAHVPAGLTFAGDRQDLEEMLGNLLDNACKWAKGAVTVMAARESKQLIISVEDDGVGLSSEDFEHALSPGTRLDESVPGTGLGLGVVRDLVTSYGGKLVLVQSSEAGGLRASLHLPALS